MEGRPWRQLGSKGALLCVSSKPALSAQRSGDAGDGAQPALYLSSISIQLPTVKETEDNNMPRPRDIADPEFIDLSNRVTECIKWW